MKKINTWQRTGINQDRYQRGFTLVEIMVTLAIMVIMAVIAIPRITTALPDMRLKAAARELCSNMQKAKLDAARTGSNVLFLFNSNARTYTFFTDENNNDTQDSSEPVTTTITFPSSIELTHSFSSGSTGFTPLGLPVDNHIGSVIFDSTSTTSKSYKVSLSTAGVIRIYTSTDGETWE